MARKEPEWGLPAHMAAEFAGTMILILFGVGVVAQVVSGGESGSLGDHDSIAWAWGLGVMFGIYVAGRITGAHLNPAVTITFALFRGFSWKMVAPYILAQTAGAFVAALLVRWNYNDMINAVDPGHTTATQTIFSTLPGNGTLPVSVSSALIDQIIGTAILLFLIVAVTDSMGTAPMANMAPLIVGLIVVAIGFAWATNAGYAINPARDFGPRLASYITGYGGAWRDQYGGLYFWVPIVGPLVGGPIGVLLYDLLIGKNLRKQEGSTPETASRLPADTQTTGEKP
ncbi:MULTISPECIES: MIP/aquaporin family protein [Nocardiaceae]|uniref:MIP/aquaporin family protein n=1 Tax=Rhodococcoides yunnanense TaxID=278209 RepID=A0ABU4B9W5_9NOCA|nr:MULTISPECIES: MIP/aquaporin family protein [Rhodococcus]MDI9893260.1 MIP/aquaporin family protein [Rhodococcus sp. IEGM 1381]MDV6260990.1 MIP/aquaporin family protein [Rhodococcus yunnanensis]